MLAGFDLLFCVVNFVSVVVGCGMMFGFCTSR